MESDGANTSTTSHCTVNARLLRLGAIAWRFGRAALVAYLLFLLVVMFLENTLIYFPVVYPGGNWKPGGLAFEDAWFPSADGTRLHGWYVPCKAGGDVKGTVPFLQRPADGDSPIFVSRKSGQSPVSQKSGKSPKNAHVALLYCHGNGGNLSHRAEVLKRLNRLPGVSVLIFDYRGYGRSEGNPSEEGILADARAARDWLAKKENIRSTEVVLLGESLGGAAAVDLAARDGAKALILESTFSSLPDVAAYHYPILPVRWLMRTRLDSARKIGAYRGPLLQAHGQSDTIVPIEFGLRLFEAAKGPKQFLKLAGHDHNDMMPAEYYDEVAKFLAQLD
jgi:uncharacterized protein